MVWWVGPVSGVCSGAWGGGVRGLYSEGESSLDTSQVRGRGPEGKLGGSGWWEWVCLLCGGAFGGGGGESRCVLWWTGPALV